MEVSQTISLDHEKKNVPNQKRQTAFKVRIKDIIDSPYIREEGWQPNYISFNGIQISRVNVIGTIVFKEQESTLLRVIIDDSSARIDVRSFDPFPNANVEIGDTITLIGRPREYNNEKFIMPEIIKKIDNGLWIKVRQKELELLLRDFKKDGHNDNHIIENHIIEKQGFVEKNNDIEIEDVKEDILDENKNNDSIIDKLFSLIRFYDEEEGAETQEIIKQSNDERAEKIIKKLLMEGEIFETRSGRIKILE